MDGKIFHLVNGRIGKSLYLITIGAAVLFWTMGGLLSMPVAQMQASTLISEGYETGGKTSYAAANVTFSSGSWNLNDALTGNLSGDARTGNYAVRTRNTGTVTMNFNSSSAGVVSLQHARYGSDGSSSWELWESTNSGSSWVKVGQTQTTSSTALLTVSFTVNYRGAVRFQLRKTAGGANRIDFDNFKITAYSAATPTPTPTPTGTPSGTPTPTPPPSSSIHLTLGNPSGATTSVSNPSNYLMEKPQYAESYHRDLGRPNWTSWHLDSSDLGSTPRQDDFRPDSSLPAGWYQVQSTDFTNSGYDRGHMCPSGDRTSSVANNSATFLMTNMVAQSPDNNQGPWASLENYTRSLVSSGTNEVYVIAGPNGQSGLLANGHVAIPSNTWKVVLVLPKGTSDVARVTTSTRVIAIWMPNQQGIRNNDWKSYRVSTDYVEQLTGYDFFSNVPASIQNVIEARIDNQ